MWTGSNNTFGHTLVTVDVTAAGDMKGCAFARLHKACVAVNPISHQEWVHSSRTRRRADHLQQRISFLKKQLALPKNWNKLVCQNQTLLKVHHLI